MRKKTRVVGAKRKPFSTLPFNREEAKRLYLHYYPNLKYDSDTLQLLLYRGELLSKNILFVSEWLGLGNNKNYRAFQERWNMDPDLGIYYINADPDPVVWFVGDHDRPDNSIKSMLTPRVTLRIDFRYSKNKIMEALKKEIDFLYPHYHSIYKDYLKDHLEPIRLKGNIPSDLQDYDRYLKVWSMKKEMSWKQLVIEWNKKTKPEITPQTARNWYKKADELIKKGIPGFLPFPEK